MLEEVSPKDASDLLKKRKTGTNLLGKIFAKRQDHDKTKGSEEKKKSGDSSLLDISMVSVQSKAAMKPRAT